MTAQGSKPREFLITVDVFAQTIRLFFNKFVKPNYFNSGEQLHVIEYSAYQALELKLAEAEARVKELEDRLYHITGSFE